MKFQTKKILYWINHIFFLSAFMFFNVVYCSFALNIINSKFYIEAFGNDSIIPVVILAYAFLIIPEILSLCFFRNIISKTTFILQILSTILLLLPAIVQIPFITDALNSSAAIFILAILYVTGFIATLIFFIKDSKRFSD